MQTKTIISISGIFLSSLLLTGCSTQPVLNINNQPIPAGLSTAQVKNAIITAGEHRKWMMTDNGYNSITGNLDYKGYTVAVDIPYTSTTYSINYKNSTNLNYNNGKINRGYNKWVTKLNNTIQKELREEAKYNTK